ncbi:MAG: S8 family peptidase [Pseudomonadota bacterium]
MVQQALETAKQKASELVGGFDERRLFRFIVEKGFNPDDLRKISPEIEFVSQEGEMIAVGFATDAALAEFELRLAILVRGEKVTNQQVLFALKGVGSWSEDDRKGWALKTWGLPVEPTYMLDVELWPLEDRSEGQNNIRQAFEAWTQQAGLTIVDKVFQPGLSLYRVQCDADKAHLLLSHRDVRSVDLPPRFGLDRALVFQDIQSFPPVSPPPDGVAGIVVLDSGVQTGHPLLGPAVGDAQSYLPGKDANDENGHGTHVAGLALYGDFETSLRNGLFIPMLRLFSGRILDRDNRNATGFVENLIEKAVRYFFKKYGCKIFNLSFGDWNKPYIGGHLKVLSVTLDTLARELGVLFVVSSGNHRITEGSPEGLEWRERYPHYLLENDWTIIEPAPALNVLTVGSLARHDRTFNSQRYQTDPSEVPIAKPDQPSPFTLHGPSVDGAIKPELMAHGGNWAVETRTNRLINGNIGLGVISAGHEFAPPNGRPFAVDSGTSMAAPQVAHLAAMILNERPDADVNLLRALLCANAAISRACQDLLSYSRNKKKAPKETRSICGYGAVNPATLFRSVENSVTLVAEGRIANKRHHFYEIPIPADFVGAGRRTREISVALAYTPAVRSTRVKYRATRLDFKLLTAKDLSHVTTRFDKSTMKDDYDRIPELGNAAVGWQVRGKGTVQADAWRFTQFNKNSRFKNNQLFVVVTRNDFSWGEPLCDTEEGYALVVSLRDRENEAARLYTQARNQIQARIRARVRT